jgi:Protein of unknown function (DUF3106)
MTQGKYRTSYLMATVAITLALPVSLMAHRPAFKQQRHFAQASALQRQQQQAHPAVPGHGGDWLRRYKDVPPAEQERALQNDPAFLRLSPEKQQQLRQRLQHFSSLPPQQQLRMLNRQETWEHLTPQQKDQVRQMQQLPPDRRRMVITAARHLASMPQQQRDQVMASERFKKMFSDQEREMVRGATTLPFAQQDSAGAENEPAQPQAKPQP